MAKSTREDLFKLELSHLRELITGEEKRIKEYLFNNRAERLVIVATKKGNRIRLQWETPTGETKILFVDLESRCSNLKNGTEYYFLLNGYRGRVLYSDGYTFATNDSVGLNYKQQNEGKIWRGYRNYINLEKILNDTYRKKYYKGRLTPYGKRYKKAAEKKAKYMSLEDCILVAFEKFKKCPENFSNSNFGKEHDSFT